MNLGWLSTKIDLSFDTLQNDAILVVPALPSLPPKSAAVSNELETFEYKTQALMSLSSLSRCCQVMASRIVFKAVRETEVCCFKLGKVSRVVYTANCWSCQYSCCTCFFSYCKFWSVCAGGNSSGKEWIAYFSLTVGEKWGRPTFIGNSYAAPHNNSTGSSGDYQS